ncbi:MAG: GNAT family N-acetyltransferase [Lewinella sp.]|nr:GNAT family N-acetyltransferase [Lewinella sp.]
MATLQLTPLQHTPGNQAELQGIINAAPAYAWRATGQPPASDEATELLTMLPPGKGYHDKFVFGLYLGPQIIGCLDIVRAYPNATTAFLGLLLLAEEHHGQGHGRAAYHLLENFVGTQWPEIKTLRLAVLRANEQVMPFWEKMGFRATGEVKPYQSGLIDSEVILIEKPLVPGT